jgi:hypothetical protein
MKPIPLTAISYLLALRRQAFHPIAISTGDIKSPSRGRLRRRPSYRTGIRLSLNGFPSGRTIGRRPTRRGFYIPGDLRNVSSLAISLLALFVAPIHSPLAAAQSLPKPTASGQSAHLPAYPLKRSANGRFLVDRRGRPFLIAGDAPQALTVKLSEAEADLYFANRRSHGFNTVWINLVCNDYTGGRKDGATFDGIAPFTTPGDLATPNPVFFDRCDRLLRLAGKYGLLVMLDPIETGGWLNTLRANGVEKCHAYGQYLGNRYHSFPNLLWLNGNDFQSWKDPNLDAVVTAVARGIKERDPEHLQTIELDFNVSSSVDDPNWLPLIGLNAAYTYYPTYAQVIRDYNRAPQMPVFLIEADYELEQGSTPLTLRRQEYWALLSGAAGQVYGNGKIWPFTPDWRTQLDSPGAVQMAYVQRLFESRAWHQLTPDQQHRFVTGGYGTFDGTTTNANLKKMDSDYATAAITPDGRLGIAYMPSPRALTVQMDCLSGPTYALWYDPSNGVYSPVAGSPFPNRGVKSFAPPGKNGDGDGDWVLVLETARRRLPVHRPGAL